MASHPGGGDRSSDPPDSDLMASFAAGDNDAFDVFYRRHVGAVTGFATKLCVNPSDVGDLAADTFETALTLARCGRYPPTLANGRNWLLGIAWRKERHLCRAFRRGQSALRRLEGRAIRFSGAEEDAIVARVDFESVRPEIQTALRKLTRKERDAVLLVDGFGFAPRDAAEVLNTSPDALETRLRRGRPKLETMLIPKLRPFLRPGG